MSDAVSTQTPEMCDNDVSMQYDTASLPPRAETCDNDASMQYDRAPSTAAPARDVARSLYPQQPLFEGLNTDLCIAVMAILPVDSLLRLRSSSRLADDYVSATLKTRFRQLVCPFIEHYELFESTLLQLAGVIGSDGALSILYPAFPMPNHIELFTSFETHTDMVGHLVETQGYTIEDVLFQEQDFLPESVSCLAWLARGDFTIAVVASCSSSPLWPITSGWNSALFAYVTPTLFEHAYPQLTEGRAALWNPQRLSAGYRFPEPVFARMAAEWASDLGWVFGLIEEDLAPDRQCIGDNSASCGAVVRSFGDRHCTRGTLLPVDEYTLHHPPHELAEFTAVWWRGGHLCSTQCHSGQLELKPQARACRRSAVRTD